MNTTRCRECYSPLPRITPLKAAEDCLKRHRQYVCSSCGRIVCVDVAGEKRARCFMPFASFETAMLYLKAAEIISGGLCGIYALTYKRGDKRFRIFRNTDELKRYLKSNPSVTCPNENPVYISETYSPVNDWQIKYLNEEERTNYLQEMQNNR